MCLHQTIALAPYMSRIYHQLRPKKTRGPDIAPSVSRLIFMRCHDNVQSVTLQSSPECRTDTTIRAGTVYIHQLSQNQHLESGNRGPTNLGIEAQKNLESGNCENIWNLDQTSYLSIQARHTICSSPQAGKLMH